MPRPIRPTRGTCGCCWPRAGCRIPPARILECRALLELYNDLRRERTAWAQRIHAVLFHQGAPQLGEGALRTEKGVAGFRAAVAGCLSLAGQLQVATALEVIDALEARLHTVRHQLTDAARHLAGAKALADRLYGVGPVTALAITCWLGGAGRFSSSRKAVRFAGLDITVSSSDRKGPPGKLSRQGPPVLRWAVYEAAKTHASPRPPTTATTPRRPAGPLTKVVLEGALEGEMDAHLGYAKHDPAGRDGGNSRNGHRARAVLISTGSSRGCG
jgi:transposase